MDSKTKTEKYSLNKENICELKIGNLNVEMNYSKSNKKIYECMLNILKQKIK